MLNILHNIPDMLLQFATLNELMFLILLFKKCTMLTDDFLDGEVDYTIGFLMFLTDALHSLCYNDKNIAGFVVIKSERIYSE